MATMTQPADLSEFGPPEELSLRTLLSDPALSLGEKLLLVEARFVHDSTPETHRVQNGGRFADAARGGKRPGAHAAAARHRAPAEASRAQMSP